MRGLVRWLRIGPSARRALSSRVSRLVSSLQGVRRETGDAKPGHHKFRGKGAMPPSEIPHSAFRIPSYPLPGKLL